MPDTATLEPEATETQSPVDATPIEAPEAPATTPMPAESNPEALVLAEIVEMNRECSILESRMVMAKENSKDATKAWESGVKRLQALIRRQDEFLPLFDRKPEPVKTAEEWRDVDIDILQTYALSAAIVEKLRDASFKTIGSLADWTAGDNLLTAIVGIGPKKAEAIEAALEGFWAANPQYGQAAVEEHVEKVDAEANGSPSPETPSETTDP